jgi:hypothetical protein
MATRAASRYPTSNGSYKMTSKSVDFMAHHFGVADEGVSALHSRIDLQLALEKDSMHDGI